MVPLVLSESSPRLAASASASDLQRSTAAADLAGWRVIHVPQELMIVDGVEDALAHVPTMTAATPAVWCGYIPFPADYAAVHQALAARHIHLLNSPEEFRKAEEFDRYYPTIRELTPKSWHVDSVEACVALAADLPFPVFVKGTVQSQKSQGLAACLAQDADELARLVSALLRQQRRSLGRVIIREYVPLRHETVLAGGFPAGREYRVFLYRSQILGIGYYWEHDDALAALSADEETTIRSLAIATATRIDVPYVAVDIGQAVTGDWLVIEAGDAQFSGISQIPIQALWHHLLMAVSDDWIRRRMQ